MPDTVPGERSEGTSGLLFVKKYFLQKHILFVYFEVDFLQNMPSFERLFVQITCFENTSQI